MHATIITHSARAVGSGIRLSVMATPVSAPAELIAVAVQEYRTPLPLGPRFEPAGFQENAPVGVTVAAMAGFPAVGVKPLQVIGPLDAIRFAMMVDVWSTSPKLTGTIIGRSIIMFGSTNPVTGKSVCTPLTR